MTLTFWLALVLLVALALLFVLYPLLLRQGRDSGPSRRQQNLDAYQDRLGELEQERLAGVIDDDLFARLKQEMAANLLADVDDTAAASPQGSRRLLLATSLAATVLVPVLAFSLYGHWGSEARLVQHRLMEQLQSGEVASTAARQSLLDQLAQRLASQPENPDGWLMLARMRMQAEQFAAAASAYERLAGLAGDDNRLEAAAAWGLAAQAHFLAAEGQLTAACHQAIARARALDDTEINATGLLGIEAFQQQDYRAAIRYWQSALTASPQHPQGNNIRALLAAAYGRLNEPVPDSVRPGSSGSPAASDNEARPAAVVTLSVGLSAEARQAVAEDAVVFVFARALEGSPRPLAIQRLSVADLPLQLRLDDTMAMSAESALRPGQQVMVVARVSVSGDARPQPGDWQGQVGPLQVRAEAGPPTPLTISEALR